MRNNIKYIILFMCSDNGEENTNNNNKVLYKYKCICTWQKYDIYELKREKEPATINKHIRNFSCLIILWRRGRKEDTECDHKNCSYISSIKKS